MRKMHVSKIRDAVCGLCLKANFELRPDVLRALKKALRKETNKRARSILITILENARIAKSERLAICQDTGMVTVFIELGREVAIAGGSLEKAVNDGVKDAYRRGYLRKSVVSDPILRKNTKTNTPCSIHTDIVEGRRIKITVSPKGFGSENKSKIMIFRPTQSIGDIKAFVIDVVRQAGPDACPPLILGIGIGGTFDKAAVMSKKALLLTVGSSHPKHHMRALEKELVRDINRLGIGPMALGGKTTVLGVNIMDFPTHIAGLPVAVNVSCHATRSATKIL